MATEQVVQWMKQDLKLSQVSFFSIILKILGLTFIYSAKQVVRNFETDFANGYLFGEILV